MAISSTRDSRRNCCVFLSQTVFLVDHGDQRVKKHPVTWNDWTLNWFLLLLVKPFKVHLTIWWFSAQVQPEARTNSENLPKEVHCRPESPVWKWRAFEIDCVDIVLILFGHWHSISANIKSVQFKADFGSILGTISASFYNPKLSTKGALGCLECVFEFRDVKEVSCYTGAICDLLLDFCQVVDDVIRLPPVPLVVMPAGAPSEKEHMDTKLLKCLVFSAATTVLKK